MKSRPSRSAQAGMTLVELMIVFTLAAIAMMIALNAFSAWSGREGLRGGVYTIQTFLHVAQSEAGARNRTCSFVLDTDLRQIQVFDLNDEANLTDDILVATGTLSPWLSFEDPSGGSAVTLEMVSSTLFRSKFNADGTVKTGAGAVFVRGGNRYYKITLYAAGGTRVELWNGSAWVLGS